MNGGGSSGEPVIPGFIANPRLSLSTSITPKMERSSYYRITTEITDEDDNYFYKINLGSDVYINSMDISSGVKETYSMPQVTHPTTTVNDVISFYQDIPSYYNFSANNGSATGNSLSGSNFISGYSSKYYHVINKIYIDSLPNISCTTAHCEGKFILKYKIPLFNYNSQISPYYPTSAKPSRGYYADGSNLPFGYNRISSQLFQNYYVEGYVYLEDGVVQYHEAYVISYKGYTSFSYYSNNYYEVYAPFIHQKITSDGVDIKPSIPSYLGLISDSSSSPTGLTYSTNSSIFITGVFEDNGLPFIEYYKTQLSGPYYKWNGNNIDGIRFDNQIYYLCINKKFVALKWWQRNPNSMYEYAYLKLGIIENKLKLIIELRPNISKAYVMESSTTAYVATYSQSSITIPTSTSTVTLPDWIDLNVYVRTENSGDLVADSELTNQLFNGGIDLSAFNTNLING